jgi:hypothetical protein
VPGLFEEVILWIYDVHGLDDKSSDPKFNARFVAIWDSGMSESLANGHHAHGGRMAGAWQEICREIRLMRPLRPLQLDYPR